MVTRRQGRNDLVELAEDVGVRCLAHVDAHVRREEPGTRDARLLAQPLTQLDRLLHDREGAGVLADAVHGLGKRREQPGAQVIVALEERGCTFEQVRCGVEVAALDRPSAGCSQVSRGARGDLR